MGRAGKNLHRSLLDNNTPTNNEQQKSDATRTMPIAKADVTDVSRKPKPDNILPTMDKHGVEDIVKHLSK